jgi:hypothetical protein
MAITLTPLATGFNNPIGIDYHRPTDSLVMSINYPTGQPYNFELVAQNGTHTQFSTISGLSDEVKIATARDSLGGFIAGELFVGTGVAGVVARVSPNGSTVTDPWVTLPGETGLIRGSLHIDRTGQFGGDLIVVTTAGGVWQVTSLGAATQLAKLDTHLEGVVTVPEDAAKYGPWAGKIIAGAEQQGRVYSIDHFGNTGFRELLDENEDPIRPEDIEIIPANANFFGVDFIGKTLRFAPASEFAAMVGDVLIATEGPPGNLWRVHWDGTSFQTERLAQVRQWEHVTFAPVEIDPPPRRMFEYVAKVVCGIQSDPRDMRLTPGAYATTINIHNPNDGVVRFIKKKLALTFPPKEQKAGEVFDSIGEGPHVLEPDQALAVDCMDIREELFKDGFPGGSGYIEGFVVIQSPASLDVTAVYTSAALDEAGQPTGHSSIDVEQVREREKEGNILGAQRREQTREL